MSDVSLHVLEREVEAARSKLAQDLSTLRSPATYSEFTSGLQQEALEMKDALVGKAKSNLQSTIEGFVDDVKAKAAANPAATLAIGAGIAWRLFQRPPIATALVGAGLYSLFRTPAGNSGPGATDDLLLQAKDRLSEQASDFMHAVKERATTAGEAAAEKVTELAGSVNAHTAAASNTAAEKVSDLTSAAKDKIQDWSGQARTSAEHVSAGLAGMASGTSATLEQVKQSSMKTAEIAATHATSTADEWSQRVQQSIGEQDGRDKLLLGAAGVAVIAALGVALQRRLHEPTHRE